jgi:hypothetical protein
MRPVYVWKIRAGVCLAAGSLLLACDSDDGAQQQPTASSGSQASSGAGGAASSSSSGGTAGAGVGGAGAGGGPVCQSDPRGRPLALLTGGDGYTLAPGVRIDLEGLDADAIAIGDVTGDGRADMVAGAYGGIVVVAQHADGTFSNHEIPDIPPGVWGSATLMHGDGDAVLDIVIETNSSLW